MTARDPTLDQAGPSGPGRHRMRIVYLVSLFPCWSETFILREIQALLRKGVDVRIFSLKHASEAIVHQDAVAMQARVTYPPRPWVVLLEVARELARMPFLHATLLFRMIVGMWRTPVTLLKTLVTWARVLGVARQLRAARVDHIHAHWATYPSTAAWILKHVLDVPFSFTAHAHDIFVENQCFRDKLMAASLTVTISEFNRAWIHERHSDARQAQIAVIHCGIDTARFEFRPSGRDLATMLSIGRLEEIKGFPYLLQAVRLLRDRGVSVRCDIVGDGRLRRELVGLIEALDLHDAVVLRGAVSQEGIRALLYAAGVFVLPSIVTKRGDRDGIPVALMEAMACGLPVVSTRVSGIPELVADGVHGLLVEPCAAAPLADATHSLIVDQDLRARLTTAARRQIEENFNVDSEATRLLAALRR